ncbi:hypothetical protein C8R45DRAFT_1093190 [Mycena sanguinolenta]|nr:hypothetical protein C8R45DRAFT_1093190 [Mycena sanguinolenta]
MFSRVRQAITSFRRRLGLQQRDTINAILEKHTARLFMLFMLYADGSKTEYTADDARSANAILNRQDQQQLVWAGQLTSPHENQQQQQRIVWAGRLTSSHEMIAEADKIIREYTESRIKLHRSIEDLHTVVKQSRNNLNLRSGMEIICEMLRLKAKSTDPRLGPGVQSVLDAVAAGSFDAQPAGSSGVVHYQTALSDVINAVGAKGGIQTKTVGYAHASLYHTLSKYDHGGVTRTIKVCQSEQTLEEAVAAMAVLLFARRLWGCQLDAEFTDSSGCITTISKL